MQKAKYDFLVMSDSDVRVEPDYLKEVMAPFANPEVGAVTAFYKSLSAGNLASNLDALEHVHGLRSIGALVANKIEGKMRFAFGWTMATSKRHLAEIGGWEAMVNYHSDDFELGKRIAQCGHSVESCCRKPVTMVFPKENLLDYLRRELRWSIGLRSVRPSGLLGDWPSPTACRGLYWQLRSAFRRDPWRWLPPISLAYLLLRLGLTWTTGKWGIRDHQLPKILWLVPRSRCHQFHYLVGGFLH